MFVYYDKSVEKERAVNRHTCKVIRKSCLKTTFLNVTIKFHGSEFNAVLNKTYTQVNLQF